MIDRPPSTNHAQVEWDEQDQPVSKTFDDIYFSKSGGLNESRYVFLEQNHLAERWRSLECPYFFTLAETGFGTGLNFLATWELWQRIAPTQAQLHFISVEKHPLRKQDLRKALSLWPELAQLSHQLIEQYPPVDSRGFHRLHFGKVTLTLIFDDVLAGLSELLTDRHNSLGWSSQAKIQVDAWYLDGFAPAKNPSMWSSDLFHLMALLSHKETTLATFTCASVVRKGLTHAGFSLTKIKGYGKKREMLKGAFSLRSNTEFTSLANMPTWHLMSQTTNASDNEHIAVVGAGLAGANVANALATRGYKVTVYERSQVANGASGNPVGIVYSKLSHRHGALADFNEMAYLYALRYYATQGLFDRFGDQCGVLQIAKDPDKTRSILDRYQNSADFVYKLNANQTADWAGVSLPCDALAFPQAGWVSPQNICTHLLKHENITVREFCEVVGLDHQAGCWRLTIQTRHSAAEQTETREHGRKPRHTTVIFANAQDIQRITQLQHLPGKGIRGQISMAGASSSTKPLKTVICADSYIAPANNDQHCIGATYQLHSNDRQLQWGDHQINVSNTQAICDAFAELKVRDIEHGRVSYRCCTPDYLPVVGAAPVLESNVHLFSALRRNSKAKIDSPGQYYPNLYVNYGHGSRGLTYTPISAELLACLISGEPLPLPRSTLLHLHPMRFLIRDLVRNKI